MERGNSGQPPWVGTPPAPCCWLSPANQYIDNTRSLMDRLGVGKGPLQPYSVLLVGCEECDRREGRSLGLSCGWGCQSAPSCIRGGPGLLAFLSKVPARGNSQAREPDVGGFGSWLCHFLYSLGEPLGLSVSLCPRDGNRQTCPGPVRRKETVPAKCLAGAWRSANAH